MTVSATSLKAINKAIRRKFAAEGFKGKLKYDPEKIIQNDFLEEFRIVRVVLGGNAH